MLEAVPDRDYPEMLGKIRNVLDELRSSNLEEMKVSEIIEFVQRNMLFAIPDHLTLALNSKEEEVDKDDKESLAWVRALQLPLRQFKAYDDYVHERTPYATHQGVKGLEFPRVLVLIDEEAAKGNMFSYEKLFNVTPLAGQAAATTQQLYNVAKIELLKYNPEWDFPEITCPVLALNGDKDCQVPVENLEFIRKGISENGNTQVKTIVFPGLNHMFQPAVTGSPVEYSDIEETIAPAVLQEIVNWLNQLK